MPKLLVTCMLLLTFNVQAGLSKFNERFQFVREDGKLIAVRDKTLSGKFSIMSYIKFIQRNILQEQALMRDSAVDYKRELNDLLVGDNTKNNISQDKGLKQDHEYVIDAMYGLEKVDFEAVFRNERFLHVMKEFEEKLKDIFFAIDPQLVAKPDNSSFFYKRNATHQAVSFALSLARKYLSTVPLLNTASYVITEVEKMIVTRRTYRQNILLHYLENFSHDELGLTKVEADSIFSSIYESRIEWYMFWESNKAKSMWERYGTDYFYQGFRAATNRFRSFKNVYTMNDRLNYAFSEAEYKGERVIVNLFDKQNMFDSKPAIAFSYDNPMKIKRLRMVLTLAELGLSFVPLPSFVKGIVEDYVKSFYEKQQITEGALLAHFEVNQREEEILVLEKQFINAY